MANESIMVHEVLPKKNNKYIVKCFVSKETSFGMVTSQFAYAEMRIKPLKKVYQVQRVVIVEKTKQLKSKKTGLMFNPTWIEIIEE